MVNYNKTKTDVKKGCYVTTILNYDGLCYKGSIGAYLVYPATLHSSFQQQLMCPS